jgi:hypothetical protein
MKTLKPLNLAFFCCRGGVRFPYGNNPQKNAYFLIIFIEVDVYAIDNGSIFFEVLFESIIQYDKILAADPPLAKRRGTMLGGIHVLQKPKYAVRKRIAAEAR